MRITWFGHSAFRLDFADKGVLIDPFFTGNPAFEGDRDKLVEGTTHILITHGHSDHVGDTLAIAERTGAKVVANFEVCTWLASKGLKSFDPMNTGGTTDQNGFTVTLVRADHSATIEDNGTFIPLGNPNGIVVKAPGEPTIYHMGDTDVFGDMALIAELHRPDVAMVPIGDRFTMGPETAALRSSASSSWPPRYPAITAPSRSSSRMRTASSPPWTAAAPRWWCRKKG